METNNDPSLAKTLATVLLLPIAYVGIIGFPQYKEARKAIEAVQEQASKNAELDSDLKVQTIGLRDDQLAVTNLSRLIKKASASPTRHPVANGTQTQVETFAQILAAFQENSVRCTAVSADGTSDESQRDDLQHMSLDGTFGNVFAAMRSIERTIPQALPVGLSMTSSDPSQPLRWKMSYRFSEEIE